jgi:hypothetical protein
MLIYGPGVALFGMWLGATKPHSPETPDASYQRWGTET